MIIKKTLALFIFIIINLAIYSFEYPVGEEMIFNISWAGITVGNSTISCSEQIIDNKPCIIITVKANSTKFASLLYPVNDNIECYIDKYSGLPYKLIKKTSEGDIICDDILFFDRKENIATWKSAVKNIEKSYKINNTTIDAISFLYFLRIHDYKINKPKIFNIAIDDKMHGIKVEAVKNKKISVNFSPEKYSCTSLKINSLQPGLFKYKIPKNVWLTDGKNKIISKMSVKVPVGSVKITLEKYKKPHYLT